MGIDKPKENEDSAKSPFLKDDDSDKVYKHGLHDKDDLRSVIGSQYEKTCMNKPKNVKPDTHFGLGDRNAESAATNHISRLPYRLKSFINYDYVQDSFSEKLYSHKFQVQGKTNTSTSYNRRDPDSKRESPYLDSSLGSKRRYENRKENRVSKEIKNHAKVPNEDYKLKRISHHSYSDESHGQNCQGESYPSTSYIRRNSDVRIGERESPYLDSSLGSKRRYENRKENRVSKEVKNHAKVPNEDYKLKRISYHSYSDESHGQNCQGESRASSSYTGRNLYDRLSKRESPCADSSFGSTSSEGANGNGGSSSTPPSSFYMNFVQSMAGGYRLGRRLKKVSKPLMIQDHQWFLHGMWCMNECEAYKHIDYEEVTNEALRRNLMEAWFCLTKPNLQGFLGFLNHECSISTAL